MSLAITLANQYGIVMSADRRLTLTFQDTNESIISTDYEQKLFLSPSEHGFSYTGDADLMRDARTSCLISDTLNSTACQGLSLHDELLLVRSTLVKQAGGKNVALMGAGIVDGKNSVLDVNLISDEVVEHARDAGRCLAYSGASKELEVMTVAYPATHEKFPPQEAINYLRFLNRSVAGLQHYGQLLQTVSDDCDVLIIQKTGSRWVTSPDSLF